MCNKNLCGIVEKRNEIYNGSGINGAIYRPLYSWCCYENNYNIMVVLNSLLNNKGNDKFILAKTRTIKEEFESL